MYILIHRYRYIHRCRRTQSKHACTHVHMHPSMHAHIHTCTHASIQENTHTRTPPTRLKLDCSSGKLCVQRLPREESNLRTSSQIHQGRLPIPAAPPLCREGPQTVAQHPETTQHLQPDQKIIHGNRRARHTYKHTSTQSYTHTYTYKHVRIEEVA